MRPLTLRLVGLRAYRTEQTIDFTDASLMAIVGPTGAGKTSLFEALFYALYGGCTWDHRSAVPLIADGMNTVVVELTFQCRNRTWRVLRSTSRGGSPPAQHVLECRDDGVLHDHKEQVNSVIEDLIGLDAKAFLKAVILPQGKFQELLHTTGRPRTEILKSILGLDQLDIMQDRAREAHDRIRPQLDAITSQRQMMFADPQAEAGDAAQRAHDGETRRARLKASKSAITAAQLARQRLADRDQRISDAAKILERVRVADAQSTYRQLLTAAQDLDAESTRVTDEINTAGLGITAIRTHLTTADLTRSGSDAVNAAIATLQAAAHHQPELDSEQAQLHEQIDALATELGQLRERREKVRAAADAAKSTGDLAVSAKQHAETLSRHLDRCANVLAAVREQTDRCRQAGEASAEANDAVASAEQTLTAAEDEANAAHTALTHAQENVEDCRRASSAAHAASLSHAGDPCPICSRELPPDFIAPNPVGEEEAQVNLKEATTRTRKADKALTTATIKLDHAKSQQTDIASAGETAQTKQDDLIAELSSLLGIVDLDDTDNHILAGAHASKRKAAKEAEQADTAAAAHLKAATEAAAALEHHERRLEERDKELRQAQNAHTKKAANLSSSLAELPTMFRTENLPAVEAIQAALALATQRRDMLKGIRDDLERAVQRRDELRTQVQELQQRHLIEIERPSQVLHTKIANTCERAADLASLLGEQGPTALAHDHLQARADWAQQVHDAAQHLLTAAEAARADLRVGIGSQDEAVKVALIQSQADTVDELDDRLVVVAAEIKLASDHLTEAQRQIPLAAKLDACITETQPLADGLKEICRLLTDGKFPSFIVARRQHALLDLASELLLGMTGHRFRFARDFRVTDGQTGQSRDPKTLSGGETFMASLALALSVVELASRSGGRIEALFLDEGFGALDPNALAGALDALAQQTVGGRLIAVISHVKAVAENIDRLLVVSKRPGGSEIHWATAAERDQLVTDTMTESMMA